MADARDTRHTRDALLDAAFDAIVAGDWARTRMSDVAAAAGVSRQTLYNSFGSKDALAAALALREAETFHVGGVAVARARTGDPGDLVGASTVWALRKAHDNPLVKAVLTDDAAGLLPFLTTRSEGILALFRDGMVEVLTERWPELGADRAELAWIAEVAVRLTISHLVVPTESPEETARHVALLVRRLLPGCPARPAPHE
jgi:AcrR family transcriptional regulator